MSVDFARMYRDFNARRIEDVLSLLAADVDWPNGWEGGRVHGIAAVRDYWTRQWAAIDATVEPTAITEQADGRTAVHVHQVVRDKAGQLLGDEHLDHIYEVRGGLIRAMEIRK